MNLKEFIAPPKECRPAPFWAWNGEMEVAEIETQLRDMHKKGIGGFVIYPGTGLKTKYMSDDWMKAVRRASEVANELKIEAWLYDEDRFPSGYGGGKVTQSNSKFRASLLTWHEDASSLEPTVLENAVAYTRKNCYGYYDLLRTKPETLAGSGVFIIRNQPIGCASFNGESYADLLNPEAVKAFLEAIHDKYSKLFKFDFGEFMPGIFTNNPSVNPASVSSDSHDYQSVSFPWSEGFESYFEHLFGYSLLDNLHHLVSSHDDGFKLRHDFRLAVSERFIESFTVPVSSWCREHELLLAGHTNVFGDTWKGVSAGFAGINHYEHFDIPCIESIGYAVFDPIPIKAVSSIAHQLGKKRAAGIVWGSTGYGLSFEEMKRICDFNFALGITSIIPQHVKYTLLGNAKRDVPPSLSYHQPYWDKFKAMSDYIARCCWAVSRGQPAASVLLLLPLSSLYGICSFPNADNPLRNSIETSLKNLVKELLENHIEFDFGDERVISRHGKVSENNITIGSCDYPCIIMPPSLSWRSSTIELIESHHGDIIIMGEPPTRVDGSPNSRAQGMLMKERAVHLPDDPRKVVDTIISRLGRTVSVKTDDGAEARSILVNHRIEAAAHMLFLVNTDHESAVEAAVSLKALGGTVELDPLTGRAFRYYSEFNDGVTMIKTKLPPSGSKLFLIDQTQTTVEGQPRSLNETMFTIEGPYAFKKLHDNTLIIDRCTVGIDGKILGENLPVNQAKKVVWEKTGISEYWGYQPWVLKEKNVRTRTNQTTMTFDFTVKQIPETLSLCMETSDRFTIEINGNIVEFTPGKWHIDRRFRVFTIQNHVVEGTNTLRVTTDFLWDTEIESIYLFGDFAAGSEEDGFQIIKEQETINTGDWCRQGYPFYSGSLLYRMEFSLEKDESACYEIDLSDTKGSVSAVRVNDTEVGIIAFPPFRGDITGTLKNGDNIIEIEVAGTLRNLLGPHHNTESGCPQMIDSETSSNVSNRIDSYRFVPYGIMKPPKLVKITF